MLRNLLAFILVFVFSTITHAQEKWVLIAKTDIDRAAGTATVDMSWLKVRFGAIRFISRKNNIVLTKVSVSYNGWPAQDEVRRIDLSANAWTAPVDLRAQENFIDRIILSYEPSGEGRTTLEVWGLHGDVGAAVWTSGFTETISLAVLPIKLDASRVVPVRNEKITGRYQSLRIGVHDSDVYVSSVTVVYSGGQRELFLIEKLIKRGSASRWLRLTQKDDIDAIYVGYRVASTSGSHARIEVWGELNLGISKIQYTSGQPYIAFNNNPKLGDSEFSASSDNLLLFGGEDCVAANKCTPVRIFFGTNREQESQHGLVHFGPNRGGRLALGSTIVTVPKRHHTFGVVERPSYWSFSDWYRYVVGAGDDPEKHIVILRRGTKIYKSPEQFIAAVRSASAGATAYKDHAFIFIHGFNTEFDDALYRLAQMSYDLGEDDQNGNRIPYGRTFLFSWPARGGTFGVKDYGTDSASAEVSEQYLEDFLELVVGQSKIKNVHVVAHSMGNQPLLNVLDRIANKQLPGVSFHQIILAAPDVDKDRFLQVAKQLEKARRQAKVENVDPIVKAVTLYASSTDKALRFSTNKVHGGIPRAGFVSSSGPVVVEGIETIDVSKVSTAIFYLNHNTYAEQTALLNDLALLLRNGTHPPHKRTPILKRNPVPATASAPKREYWSYP